MRRLPRRVVLAPAMKTLSLLFAPLLFALGACAQSTTPVDPAASVAVTPGARPSHSPLGSVPAPLLASAPPLASASAPSTPSTPAAFGERVTALSEPDGPFFSDNTISNETSYLQVAAPLARLAAPGGAYIGVGPEQSFTYIALTRPKLAFILDIRRQNMILHLLYKAIFEEATSRAHFVALLLGRPHAAAGEPGEDAGIDAVLAHVEKSAPDQAGFAAAHALLRERVARSIPLDAEDKKTLEVVHRSFLDHQLELRFELKQSSGRRYPTLRELLTQRDPEGKQSGFLASEAAFRFVQTMEKEGRIVPVVGDFAGDRAMPGIAAEIARQHLTVSAFYVSNVEQYLFEPGVWARWSRNVAALPIDEKSLFIRAWLDQGQSHPQQLAGHRTATLLQRIGDFEERQAKKPFASWLAVATFRVVDASGAAR
jgi:hypothetical protein